MIFPGKAAHAAGVVDMTEESGGDTEATTDDTGLTDTQKDVVNNNDTDLIMGDYYEFGENVLPDKEPQGFFIRIYKKMFEGLSAVKNTIRSLNPSITFRSFSTKCLSKSLQLITGAYHEKLPPN